MCSPDVVVGLSNHSITVAVGARARCDGLAHGTTPENVVARVNNSVVIVVAGKSRTLNAEVVEVKLALTCRLHGGADESVPAAIAIEHDFDRIDRTCASI